MSVKVKICGLKTTRALDTALIAGADYFGLVFYGPSPRNVELEAAAILAERGRNQAQSVALMVNPDDEALQKICDIVSPDLIQLHGDETPDRAQQIKALVKRPLIKAVKVDSKPDVASARAYQHIADIILYDAKAPTGMANALPGGNGVPFDWRALASVKGQRNFMLSGGLDPDNVAAAVAMTHAPIVDVSSGVESAPGIKDDALIHRFIAETKATTRAETMNETENV